MKRYAYIRAYRGASLFTMHLSQAGWRKVLARPDLRAELMALVMWWERG